MVPERLTRPESGVTQPSFWNGLERWEYCVGEVGVGQVRTRDVRAAEVCTSKGRTGEPRTTEVRADEPRRTEVRIVEAGCGFLTQIWQPHSTKSATSTC